MNKELLGQQLFKQIVLAKTRDEAQAIIESTLALIQPLRKTGAESIPGNALAASVWKAAWHTSLMMPNHQGNMLKQTFNFFNQVANHLSPVEREALQSVNSNTAAHQQTMNQTMTDIRRSKTSPDAVPMSPAYRQILKALGQDALVQATLETHAGIQKPYWLYDNHYWESASKTPEHVEAVTFSLNHMMETTVSLSARSTISATQIQNIEKQFGAIATSIELLQGEHPLLKPAQPETEAYPENHHILWRIAFHLRHAGMSKVLMQHTSGAPGDLIHHRIHTQQFDFLSAFGNEIKARGSELKIDLREIKNLAPAKIIDHLSSQYLATKNIRYGSQEIDLFALKPDLPEPWYSSFIISIENTLNSIEKKNLFEYLETALSISEKEAKLVKDRKELQVAIAHTQLANRKQIAAAKGITLSKNEQKLAISDVYLSEDTDKLFKSVPTGALRNFFQILQHRMMRNDREAFIQKSNKPSLDIQADIPVKNTSKSQRI